MNTITSFGIVCYSVAYGYVFLYILKRLLPPITERRPTISELVLLLGSLGVGGLINAAVRDIDGRNYIGPYGNGLLVGVASNVIITLALERLHRNS